MIRLFKRFFAAFVIFLAFTEIILSNYEPVKLKVQQKKIHCLSKERYYLFLCANQKRILPGIRNSTWEMTTNRYGERITASYSDEFTATESTPNLAEIWIIGDSITMGYLLDDQNTPPYLLARNTGLTVRNLGVDSLGTTGIQARLEKAFRDRPVRPYRIYWIYNISDFIDDVREKRMKEDSLYRTAYTVHHLLASYSHIYTWLYSIVRSGPSGVHAPSNPDGQTVKIPDDHLTLQNIDNFIKKIESLDMKLTVVFYPGMLPDGSADLNDPYKDAAKERFRSHGTGTIDLTAEFTESSKDLYTRGDGHPTEKAAMLFAASIEKHLKEQADIPVSNFFQQTVLRTENR